MGEAGALPPEVFGADGFDLAQVAGLPGADVFDLPSFLSTWGAQFKTRPGYFVWEGGGPGRAGAGGDLVVYPFQLQPVSALGLEGDGASADDPVAEPGPRGGDLWDLITQEYGGPIVVSDVPARAFASFREAFRAWCREAGVVTELVRVTPFRELGPLFWPPDGVEAARSTVAMDLTPDEDALFRSLRKGHKAKVRQLEREGVTVREGTPDDIGAFLDIYHALMDAKRAKDIYYLTPGFVRAILEADEYDGRLIIAEHEGRMAAASLFIGHGRTMHYYYSGTSHELRTLGASTLVVWEAALAAKRAGYEVLHLGGGATGAPDDSLLSFKKGFVSDGLVPFLMYRELHLPDEYSRLCGLKAARDGGSPPGEIQEGFFPWYREPRSGAAGGGSAS
jgi:hypothetical protein